MAAGRRQAANAPKTLRQNINFNGSYSHTAADNRNIFLPLGGKTETNGYGVTAGYTIGYGRLTNNASINWNRSHSTLTNYFTNVSDPLVGTGISIPKPVIGSDPGIYYGLPSCEHLELHRPELRRCPAMRSTRRSRFPTL